MGRHRHSMVIAVMVAGFLSACGDSGGPEKDKFVSLCVKSGNTEMRCSCTFDLLEKDIGDVDMDTVDFISDFSSWDMEGRQEALSRDEIIAKYDLTEDDYSLLTETVGHVMLKGYADCPAT